MTALAESTRSPTRPASLVRYEPQTGRSRVTKLDRADLRGANLLTGASLAQAKLSHTDLRGAVLRGAVLTRVDLTETHLTGADLQDADFRHLDIAFEFVELIGVQLDGAKFKNGVRCAGFPAKGGWGCESARNE